LDKYLVHPSKEVRKLLVNKFYKLDVLINDLDEDIKKDAKLKMFKIETLERWLNLLR
jgi:hypothetical protein